MRWLTSPGRCKPYPEIVEDDACGSPYRIGDTRTRRGLPTNGMTNKLARELLVPLQPTGRPVSRHELAHVQWSPLRHPRVRYDVRVLLAVEDARINMGLDALGIPVVLRVGERANVGSLAAKDLERGDVAAFVMRALASLGTNAVSDVLGAAADAPSEIQELAQRLVDRVRAQLDRARQRAGGPVAPFQKIMRIARRVARELEALGLLRRTGGRSAVDLAGAGCCLCDGDGEDGEGAAAGRGKTGPRGEVEPGRMSIGAVPLDVACERGRPAGARAWRPSTEGSVVRYMHRYALDRAVFRRVERQRGGSVLVDTSGSMSLNAEGVDRIIRGAPSATLVAIYSGRGAAGELRVVARDGRRAGEQHLAPFGGANVVDLPALEWLAKQPPPRVWISDGAVTGVGDARSDEITRRCAQVCARFRIRRVGGVEEAAAILAGRRATG